MKICCIDNCDAECVPGRRYCREHYLKRASELARRRYLTKGRYKYNNVCIMCDKPFAGDRKSSKFCSRECYRAFKDATSNNASNNYERAHGGGYSFMHRRVAETCLGRRLARTEVVHHIDGDPMHNSPDNLIVLSLSDHTRLHAYLAQKRVLISKGIKENSENCWDNLRDQITKTWLEMTGVKVIKKNI